MKINFPTWKGMNYDSICIQKQMNKETKSPQKTFWGQLEAIFADRN